MPSGITLPPPISRMTLGVEPGKSPDPSKVLHEVAHAISFLDFGGIAPAWDVLPRAFTTDRRWNPFIDAVQSYKGNPPPQLAAINKELYDELKKSDSYLWTSPMEAYARIAELSGGDLGKMPSEFRKFYPWLGRKERVRELP